MTPTRELALISARLRTIRGSDGELLKDRTLLSTEAIDAVCLELLETRREADALADDNEQLRNVIATLTINADAYLDWLERGPENSGPESGATQPQVPFRCT